MPRAKASATQAEVSRYLRALLDAGFEGGRVEIEKPDGTRIRVIAGKQSEGDADDDADDIDRMIGRLP